jgi:hypothetical protein
MLKRLIRSMRVFQSSKTYLILFWIAVATFQTACNISMEVPLHALFGFSLLAFSALLFLMLGYWILVKSSPIVFGLFVGVFLATIIEMTLPPSVQVALIGGMVGISIDKLTTRTAAELPVTIVDRLALLVYNLADSIKDASIDAGNPARIRSIRRGIWAAAIAVLTVLLVGRAADSIGLSGTAILHSLRHSPG